MEFKNKHVVGVVLSALLVGLGKAAEPMASLDWSNRFGGRTIQTLAGNFDTMLDFRAHDFDGDGAFDFLFVDVDGVWVCWGICNGAVGDPELILSKRSMITQFAFEEADGSSDYPELLWLRVKSDGEGDRIEAHRFEKRSLIAFREINESLVGGMRCTGHGLLFQQMPGADLVLERHGALVRLMGLDGEPRDLDLDDVDGDGLMDVVVEMEGKLGVAFGQAGDTFSSLRWLPADYEVSSWDVQRDLGGRPGLLVGSRYTDGVDRWSWQAGHWVQTVVRPNNAGQLINHHSSHYDGAALAYHPIYNTLHLYPYDAASGTTGHQNITELTARNFVHITDFNGDGIDDVVAFDCGERKLHVVRGYGSVQHEELRWSRLALEVMEPIGDLPFAFSEPAPLDWFQGQEWNGHRDWALAESGVWSLGDQSSAFRKFRVVPLGELESSTDRPMQPCIDVGYLIYEKDSRQACLPLDLSNEWHRLSYSRGPLGQTAVALDGKLVFEGYSEGRNYDHRMVQFGADFGQNWRFHLAADLDEFRLYRGHVNAEDLLRYHLDMDRTDPLPLIGTVTLDGSDPHLASPSYEEVTWEAGAEVVATPWGQGLRFDGEGAHAYVFLDVPEDALMFDVRFKLIRLPEETGSLLTLYGMFNLNTEIRMGYPQGPVAHSPDRFDQTDLIDQMGGHLLVHGGQIRRVLPNGEFMRMAEGDWAMMPSEALPHGWSEIAPWTQAGSLWGIFGGSSVWRCESAAADWEEVGQLRPFLRGIDHVVSTGSAALVWSEDGTVFGWLDAQENAYYPLDNRSLPEQVFAARPGFGGVELMEADGAWFFVPAPGNSATSREAFVALSPWWFIGGGSGIGLLLGVGLLTWRKRSKKDQVSSLEAPASVNRNLRLLLPYAGRHMEVQDLDEVLGFGDLETDETRRSRRSRSINELNAWSQVALGVELIERQRDPLDRRRSIYVVREELAAWSAQAGEDLA